jgi:MFS transporter, DHA2 family, multidrug resistance protein
MATQTANATPSITKATKPASGQEAQSAAVSQFRWLILLGLIAAAIMEVLDSTIVNVALPQMAGNLGASMQEVTWVSTGYILANVVFLPMTAFLTATFGRRNYLSASIVIFIIASFLCGTSNSLGEIVLWRVLQGAGGAALLSTAQATIRQIFPEKEQGIVQPVFLLGIIVAPTLGPTLGGWITDNYTWNWCFFINIPIGLMAVALVFTLLQDPPGMVKSKTSIDLPGITLLAVGLSCLQYVLEEGQQDDWFNDAWIVRFTIISIVSLSVLIWWELSPHNRAPVVDFRVLKNRDLASSCILFLAMGFGLYAGTFIFPQLAQNLLGFSPTRTGLALLPGGLGTAVSVLVCGRILGIPRMDARLLILFGFTVFAYAMWNLGHLSTSVGESEFRMGLLLRGIALGFLFTPINSVAFGSVEPKNAQQASGMINLARQLGGSFGTALISTYLVNMTQFHRVNLLGNIRNSNTVLDVRLQALTSNFISHGYSQTNAQSAALAAVSNTLTNQATMMAYNNCWILILLVFVVTSPAILLLRKPRPGAAPVET